MAAASSVTIVGGPPPEEGQPGPRVRRARVDGLSGVKQAVFLEGISVGLTVAEAAAKAEISVTAVYNFANRHAGRAFAIAWDAAARRARRSFADHLHERALKGQTEILRDKDGALIGTRHRLDNRLALGMLTRLDRKAEAWREDERLIAAVSEEFEELLDIIEAEGNAMAFIDSRRPVGEEYQPQGWLTESDHDRVDAYYMRRPCEEGARMPNDIIDPYPDSGRDPDGAHPGLADESGR
ncbi:MAG TPA: hypothetical protein VEX35_03405 [Allosphingosinicella sp.]|nr:hypothetical protein [Allosphingosinicella sp.]